MTGPGKNRPQKQLRLDEAQCSNGCKIGVISDTHGLVRSKVLEAFRGSDLIIHAGDICKQEVLDSLSQVAPVVAVRGNNDKGKWADHLHETEIVEVGSVKIGVVHVLRQLDINPKDAGLDAIISGHSHRASIKHKDGIIYINPGAAGKRMFGLPVTVALMKVDGINVNVQLVTLDI
jgi:uncharacterized protein